MNANFPMIYKFNAIPVKIPKNIPTKYRKNYSKLDIEGQMNHSFLFSFLTLLFFKQILVLIYNVSGIQ